jgi:hypothetical protein
MSPTDPNPPNRRPIAAIVVGGFVAVIAAVFLAAGGALIWGESQKDADGYLSTDSERYATTTNAIATEDLDLDDTGPGVIVDEDAYGKVRLRVEPNAGKPVFVGIAPTDRVESYLAGTSHTTLTDVDYAPFEADYRDADGTRRPAAPAAQDIWAASAHGAGTQTLTWDVESGSWSVVVMNADGSAGVDAGVSAGANVPVMDDLAWAATSTGLVLMGGALVLLVVGIRARPRRPGPSAPAHEALVTA